MSYRFMRMLVMFDLPVETAKQRKNYAAFRKYLIKSGFLMMQESIYSKIVQNGVGAETILNALKRIVHQKGLYRYLL